MRRRAVRVRIAPGTPRHPDRRPAAPCTRSSPGSTPGEGSHLRGDPHGGSDKGSRPGLDPGSRGSSPRPPAQASPSVSVEHWLSGYSSAPLRRPASGCRRFESCMLRARMADRDGKVPGRKPEAGVHAPRQVRVLRHPLRIVKPPRCGPNRLGCKASSFFLLPLATTQPVDGARLINGYGAVRLRGGQLAGS
jgi:hypothetical protein